MKLFQRKRTKAKTETKLRKKTKSMTALKRHPRPQNRRKHKKWRISIRKQLILCFFIPVLCIIVLGLVSYRQASRIIVSNYEDASIANINTAGEYYNLILTSVEDKSLQILNDTIIKQYYSGYYKKNVAEENEILKTLRNNIVAMATADSIVENIAVITSYGKEAVSYGSFLQTSVETPYEAYVKTEEAKQVIATDKENLWYGYHKFFDDELGIKENDYGISLIRQYYNSGSKPIGFIMIDVKKSILQDVISGLNLPEGSSFAFITPDGREITDSDEGMELLFTDKQFYIDSTQNDNDNGYKYVDVKGIKYLYVYTKVGDTGVMACSLIPASYFTGQADIIRNLTIVIVCIASFIAILTGFLISNGISGAIKNIMDKLSVAANGNLTIEIKTKRKDEFRNLVSSINHMIINMKNLIEKTSRINNKVLGSSNLVASSSEHMLESSKNISNAIHDIQHGVVEQAEDTEQCLSQTNDLSERIGRVYNNAGDMDQIAATAKDIVKEGIIIIDNLSKKAKATAEINRTTISNIEELEAETISIGSIIKVITEIADQTNLLALNANIEAARAGTAGKGFVVVADEIRKLAEGSSEAASKISQIIGHIQNKTKVAVATVKETEVIIQSQEDALHNTIHAFENINTHVERLAKMIDSISSEIHDIEQSKATTLNAIMNISAISEESAAASEEVETTAEKQLDSVTRLNEAAQELRGQVKQLEEAISAFKI
ncbi:methyl-accepting chemotaxis protein [Mobilisporobacter senegalensis]|uniref:Methyl-accepting chemotaxis protein n=1 Tax=Mobilisporobacter senegalensis TaxID=1329262 RepID=A0A3N1XXW3_9FIRM|nr:methyl-accepting chemotaxis protein [Mobilisporobacter senegalensis]ROR31446.1 methyl-accepting chemotaxis protein [Mobilisporobacter senegalensis]